MTKEKKTIVPDDFPRTQTLESELHKIGFIIRNHGCNHFFIYNQYGNKTQFMVFDDRIRVETQVFGAKGAGAISFNLRCCNIEYDKEHQMVSVVMHDDRGDGEVFVSFYGKKIYGDCHD